MKTNQSLSKVVELTLPVLPNGLTELKKNKLTPEQKKYLKSEIGIVFACRNEHPNFDILDIWIDCIEQMYIEYNDLISRLRVARLTKRYGVNTTLADIFGEEITKENDVHDIHAKYFKYLEVKKITWLVVMPCSHSVSFVEKPEKAICSQCQKEYDIIGDFEQKSDILMEISL